MPAPVFVAPEAPPHTGGLYELLGERLYEAVAGFQRKPGVRGGGGPRRDQSAATTESPGFTKKSHIISHGQFSSAAQNVAIPTTQIQGLKQPQGNYVRHCLGTMPATVLAAQTSPGAVPPA